MGNGKWVAKSAMLIIALSLLSKILGFSRETVIAAAFGASSLTDAYVVALTVPTVFFYSLSRSIQITFIPVFIESLHQGEKQAFFFANSLINIIFVGITLLSVPVFILTPEIVKLLSPGFTPETFELTVILSRIMLPAGVIWGIIGIVGGILNARQNFSVPAAVGVFHNIIIIVSVFTLGRYWGIKGLALGTALGVFSQLMWEIFWLKRSGFQWKPKLQINSPPVRKMGLLLLPVIGTNLVVQLNVVVDRILASHLPEGSISALNFGNRLNGFVLGIFIFALVTVIFPTMSQKAVLGDIEGFKNIVERGVRIVLFLTLPVIAAIIILKIPIIKVLFQRGAFDSQDTVATATAFFYYGLGLAAFSLREVVNTAFYALQETRIPMLVGTFCLILNIGLNLILVRFLAHGGLALATSISAVIYVIVLLFLLHRRLNGIDTAGLLATLGKTFIASVFMGFVLWLIWNRFNIIVGDTWTGQVVFLGVLTILGGSIYFAITTALKEREAVTIVLLIREEIRKRFCW